MVSVNFKKNEWHVSIHSLARLLRQFRPRSWTSATPHRLPLRPQVAPLISALGAVFTAFCIAHEGLCTS
eukprot:scaffold116438_cov33-Tisochrysis_lutea.AAC.2